MKPFPWKTASIITLGCRLNQADTALTAGRLASAGIRVTEGEAPDSDIYVVNSCAVTASASRKSRQILRSLRKSHPDALFILTGCSANDPEAAREAHILLSNEGKKSLLEKLEKYAGTRLSFLPEPAAEPFFEKANSLILDRAKANLKIQEGCNNFCSYCIVPYTRGRERSRDLDEVLSEFRHLLDLGFREITLTGINTCTYFSRGTDLPGLLKKLLAFSGDFRIRVGSVEPGEPLYAVMDLMAEYPEKLCPFLHPSLQHGSDTILKAMNRRYTASEYGKFVAYARAKVPLIHIGTDVITGFPGETEDLFRESFDFIRTLHFANMHIFPYSVRKGTKAALMKPKIPEKISAERALKLRELKEQFAREYRQSLFGTKQRVLVEKRENGVSEGWTGTYVRVRVPEGDVGELVSFTMTENNLVMNHDL